MSRPHQFRTHTHPQPPPTYVQKPHSVGFLGDRGAAGHPKLLSVRFRKTRTSENEFGHCRTNLSSPPPPKPPPPTGNQAEAVFQVSVLTIICAFECLKQMLLPSEWVLGEAGAAVSGVRVQNEWKPKALTKHELCEPGCSRCQLGNGRPEQSFKQEAGVDDWAKMSCRCAGNPMVGEPPSSLEGDKQDGERRQTQEGGGQGSTGGDSQHCAGKFKL